LQRSGTALYVIKPGGGRTDISTPYGRAGVRGSALFVRVNEETSTMIVGALTNNPAGPMEVTVDNGPKQRLEAGQMAVVRGGQITMFEFDLNKFYQTSSLVQGFGLDGKAVTGDDATLADPEIQQTLQAVQAETIPALTAQKPVVGTDVAVNPGFLNSSSRDLKPADLIMQATAGGFDRNSSQTAAGIALDRQGVNGSRNPGEAAVPLPILPVAVQAPPIVGAPPLNPATLGTPTAVAQPPTTTVGGTTPVVAPPANPLTPTVPDRTAPTATPANPVTTPTQPIVQPVAQPNNPQLPVIQPIAQPVPAGGVGIQTPSVIQPISQPVPASSVSSPSMPSRVEPVATPAHPVIPVIIRVEVETRVISTPSRVEPSSLPVVQPIPAAPVVPVTAPVVNNLITPEVPLVASPPRVEPVSTPAVTQPTVTPTVTPTLVVQPTVTPPVTPTLVVQPTVTTTLDRVAPTATPAVITVPPVVPVETPVLTPDPKLTAPQ
jgi:hypothetical protein